MDILLSIKPQYVNEMIQGNKLYEFRSRVPKNDVDTVYIYQTTPIKKITHYFKCTRIIKDSPFNVWNKCCKHAGMTRQSFFDYFANKNIAYALEIDDFRELDKQYQLSEFNVKSAPQSFLYLK